MVNVDYVGKFRTYEKQNKIRRKNKIVGYKAMCSLEGYRRDCVTYILYSANPDMPDKIRRL